jgi:hypothetical protein
MSSFEAVVDAVRGEGTALRKQLADQAPEQESPAVRDRKDSQEEGREVKKVDLLTIIAENVTGQKKKLDEIKDTGDSSLWGALKKALLFGTIALAIPAIQGFLEAKGWKGLKDGFQKLYCWLIEGESIIDKTSRFVKEEILPLLTIEGLKRLASNLNKNIFIPLRRLYGSVAGFLKDLKDGCYDDQIKKITTGLNDYIFRPLGRFYGKLVTFFRNLFEGKYDDEIKKIKKGFNDYIFIPLGCLYNTVKNFFRDLFEGEYDDEIKKIKFAFNNFILNPLKRFGGWVSEVKMEDLEKAGRKINDALIIIGGVLAATKAVFEAITMPIRGLLLLYDTISDFFGDAEKKQTQTKREVLERRLKLQADKNSPEAQRIQAQLFKLDEKESNDLAKKESSGSMEDAALGDARDFDEPKPIRFDVRAFALMAKRAVALRKEREELLAEQEKLEKQLFSVSKFIEKRREKGGKLDQGQLDRQADLAAALEALKKSNQPRLQGITKEIEELDLAGRQQEYKQKPKPNGADAAVVELTKHATKEGSIFVHDIRAIEKMDEVVKKINEASLNKAGGAAAPIVVNSVTNAPVDASSSSVTSAGSTPISPPPNYVAIL